MKRYLGLLLLVLLLALASGCALQQAKSPAPAATATTPVSPTEIPAAAATSPSPVPSPVMTTAAARPAITTSVPTPTITPSTRVTVIHMRNNTFVPDTLRVLPGTGITWINDDSHSHVVKAIGDHAGKFTSNEIVTGAQYGYTFGDATGTFEFADPGYPDMKGAILIVRGQALVGAPSQQQTAAP